MRNVPFLQMGGRPWSALIRSVSEVIRSGRLSLGAKAEELGARIAARVGVRHGVAVSSGTAALHLIACKRRFTAGSSPAPAPDGGEDDILLAARTGLTRTA